MRRLKPGAKAGGRWLKPADEGVWKPRERGWRKKIMMPASASPPLKAGAYSRLLAETRRSGVNAAARNRGLAWCAGCRFEELAMDEGR